MKEDLFQERLNRIERLQLDAQLRLVRLEYRLERSGAFSDGEYFRDAELRFALENGLDPRILMRENSVAITLEFYEKVSSWLASNEDETDVSFTRMAHELSGDSGTGKEIWPALQTLIEYFALTRQWESMLEKLTADHHPSNLRRLLRHPFKATER